MKIFWATRLRGFLKHLSSAFTNAEFVSDNNYYETNTLLSKIKSKLIRVKVFDFFGLFQTIDIKNKNCDFYASFNRFLKCDKPYFIYLENPTALYHYALGRIKHPLGKKRFSLCLNDKNLKYIVCMSDACKNSFSKINGNIPKSVEIRTVYPYVPSNKYANDMQIERKSNNEILECLFCVQGTRFISKGGLETLSAFENLINKGYKLHLNIITKISDLDKKIYDRIISTKNVDLNDFTYSYEELEKIYANTNLLIQPSSDDSFGLTVLEAIKGGCAIITTKMYAFKEMVIDGENGYLLEPKFWFFDKNDIPNVKVWNHRNRTIHSKKESIELCAAIEKSMETLYLNRDLLLKFSKKSLDIANEEFSGVKILNSWNEIFNEIKFCGDNYAK